MRLRLYHLLLSMLLFALIFSARIGRTQDVLYELLPKNSLGHIHVDENGNRQYFRAELRGTFSVSLFQSSEGIGLAIRNISFKSIAGPEYNVTGRGRYTLDATKSGHPGLHYAELILQINEFKNVLLAIPELNGGEDFPPVTFYVSQFGDPPMDYFGLYLKAAPVPADAVRFFHRGDTDGDGETNIADPIVLLSFLFLAGETPGCLDASDTNDDGRIDVADPVFVLASLFLGQGRPPVPSPLCGLDPTEDDLGCGGQAGCMAVR